MKALVYGGPGARSWTDVPNPAISRAEKTDAMKVALFRHG